MMGTDWGYGWGGMFFGWFIMAGLTVAFVLFIVWLVRLSTASTSPGPGPASPQAKAPSALEILDARYARGEITKEEYLDMRATLRT